MNVSLQNIDKVSAELTVKLEKADYQEKVDKELKSLRQKAQIPGFRKGMVPTSLIKKMYGKSVIAEVVNKALQEAVYNYIKDNKVNMLGEPLPNEEKQQNIDFDTMEEFDFVFDIALAPEFKAEVSAKDKVDYYSIEVSEEMIDNQVKMYTQRTGKYDKVDAYEDNDMLKGLLAQLDEEGNTKEGGIQVEAAVLMPAYMKNDDQKAIFANAKVNDVLVFNPNVAYDGHAAELGSLLKIDKEIAKDVKSDFSFQVEEITRFVPGELTQEVFDQAFGEGVVKTEEEFRAKIKEEIALAAACYISGRQQKFKIAFYLTFVYKFFSTDLTFSLYFICIQFCKLIIPQFMNCFGKNFLIRFVPQIGNEATLLRPQHISCSTDIQILHGYMDTAAQITEILNGLKTALCLGSQ